MATNRLLTTEQFIKVAIPGMILATVIVVSGFAQTHTTTRHRKDAVEEQPAELVQAEEAIQKNQFAAAEPLLKRTLERDPKNYQAWFDLGFIYNRLNRTDDSIQAYRQSVAAKPDVFESNLNLGLMLARNRNPEAEQFLRAATTLKPVAQVEEGRARAWLSLGHLIQETKPDDALAAYEKAATLTPRDTEPHLSAALLLERRKDFSGAEAAYKQVLALDPHSVEAAVGLTNVYMRAGRLAEAEPLLRDLVSLRADDADLHLQLGRVLAAQGKKDQAMPEFETALQLAPGDREAQRDLADLFTQSDKLADAEKAYRRLLTANPNDADLHHILGGVLLKQRQFPEAQKEFETAVRLKP